LGFDRCTYYVFTEKYLDDNNKVKVNQTNALFFIFVWNVPKVWNHPGCLRYV